MIFSQKKSKNLYLYVHETLTLITCQSVRKCPNFLKLWLITNFDMGFQKNDIRSRSEKFDFSNGRFLAEPPLKVFRKLNSKHFHSKIVPNPIFDLLIIAYSHNKRVRPVVFEFFLKKICSKLSTLFFACNLKFCWYWLVTRLKFQFRCTWCLETQGFFLSREKTRHIALAILNDSN